MSDWQYLDRHLRLRLTALSDKQFEDFFLLFLNAGVSLTIQRNGQAVTRRIISANTYAAGSGRRQEGIDLRAEVEGGEVWAFQCKRHKKWTPGQTQKAITSAAEFNAHHNFLLVACDPQEGVQKVIEGAPNWTFWNLDRICAEFRLRVPPSQHAQVLFFLPPEELRRFVPFTTDSLVTPQKFFERFLGSDKLFRHDWSLTGREHELQQLRTFHGSADRKVLFLTAKGGDGKSRLLWEYSRPGGPDGPEILCLNPHAHDTPTLAFTGPSRPRVVIVDDAHRIELVTPGLLELIAGDKDAKLILAGRPQAQDALMQRLFEHGFQETHFQIMPLPPLRKAALGHLAAEALGPEFAQHAAGLEAITAESAFFTVIAGSLIRQRRLQWNQWASDQQFRQHVFRAFEEENLRSLPESDRRLGSHLLRLLALAGPVEADTGFLKRAARCLEVGPLAAEDMLQRLERAELLTGDRKKLRVLPDLFADFLIYDTAFEPGNRKPAWVARVLKEFTDNNPTLLRNLAEAAWVAKANGVTDDSLLRPLLVREQKRFRAASHYDRAAILQQWSAFCVYLPTEALALAESALRAKQAPKPKQVSWFTERLTTHAYVLEQIPALLRPIAQHQLAYQSRALDILWELGRTQKRGFLGLGQGKPWEVIAGVLRFEPNKRLATTKAGLDWVENLVKRPGMLRAFEGANPVLSILLTPCFARSVEFTQVDGRKFSRWERAVSLTNTQPLRDQALRIVEWVIAQDSWLAALDGLSVLERAMRRIVAHEAKRVGEDPDAYLKEWRPERLKALAATERLLQRHPQVVVRLEVRRTLLRDIAYEEDAKFAQAAREVLKRIVEDLPLRTLNVLMGHGTYEFLEEVGVPRGEAAHKKVEDLWEERLRAVAGELLSAYPTPAALLAFLDKLLKEATSAGHHPSLAGLFFEISKREPGFAVALAKLLLAKGGLLAAAWPFLITRHPALPAADRLELLREAARRPGLRGGLIQVIETRLRTGQAVTPPERNLLMTLARTATPEEAGALLQFIEWIPHVEFSFACKILRALPTSRLTASRVGDVLEALFPYQPRQVPVPRSLVQHILKALVSVPRLDWENHHREWEELQKQFPQETYAFFVARLRHRSSKAHDVDYHSLPEIIEGRFRFEQLASQKNFPAICGELWRHALGGRASAVGREWLQFFHAVVMPTDSFWRPKLLAEVSRAPTIERLGWLTQFLSFEGSLIIFRMPEIVRAFLQRATAVGGEEGMKRIRSSLYVGAGPHGRSYTEGVLEKDDDYVEAEALKAAEAHSNDPDLGPFYRWIVEVEQRGRQQLRLRHEAYVAEFD